MPLRLRSPQFLLACVVLLLAGVLVAPSIAAAAKRGSVPTWPGRTISYHDASRDKVAVRRAVMAWNRSGLRIRFVRARSARTAQVVIRNTRDVPAGCGTGTASLGYVGRGRKAYVNILNDPRPKRQGCSQAGQTLVVAHELGHVLGLRHVPTRRCSLMNPAHVDGVAPAGCFGPFETANLRARLGTWRCRILEPFDVRRAIGMYGGRLRPMRGRPWCNLFQQLPAVPAIVAAWDEASQRVKLTLRRPATRPIPPYLRASANSPERFEVYRAPGSCIRAHRGFGTPDYDDTWISQWTVPAGSDEVFYEDELAAGTWCWSAWARDALGKPGAGPTTMTLAVPEVEDPAGADSRGRAHVKTPAAEQERIGTGGTPEPRVTGFDG